MFAVEKLRFFRGCSTQVDLKGAIATNIQLQADGGADKYPLDGHGMSRDRSLVAQLEHLIFQRLPT